MSRVRKPLSESFYEIFPRWGIWIVFYPIIAPLKWLANKALGPTIMRLIVPAQKLKQFDFVPSNQRNLPPEQIKVISEQNRKEFFNHVFNEGKQEANYEYQLPDIETYDGIKLDTLEIIPKHLANEARQKTENKNNADGVPIDPTQKYIIKFLGNKSSYALNLDNSDARIPEQNRGFSNYDKAQRKFESSTAMKEMMENATKHNRRVILFNYRGVGCSTGRVTSGDDLVVDGIAQVQRLLDAGVPSENIMLKAHSLGGFVALKVEQYFARKGIQFSETLSTSKSGLVFYGFNSRSGSSISEAVVATYLRRIGHATDSETGKIAGYNDHWSGRVISWFLRPIVRFLLKFTKCNIDAAEAYSHLKPNTQLIITADNQGLGDTVMRESAALCYHRFFSANKNKLHGLAQKATLLVKQGRIEAAIKVLKEVKQFSNPLLGDNAQTIIDKLSATADKSLILVDLKSLEENIEKRHMFIARDPKQCVHDAAMIDLTNHCHNTAEAEFDEFVRLTDLASATQHYRPRPR